MSLWLFLFMLTASKTVSSSDCDDDQETEDDCENNTSTGIVISIVCAVFIALAILIALVCICKRCTGCGKNKKNQGSNIQIGNGQSTTPGFNNYIYGSDICVPTAPCPENNSEIRTQDIQRTYVYYVNPNNCNQQANERRACQAEPAHLLSNGGLENPPSYEEAVSMSNV